ncbi:CPBP family intramembrane metalloprotease [Nonomuraea sp. NBC_01738]|uniref:CPBP family intramembrane glutamic endopeptidase n=1 Tax=Nonomuraea sp. NBC_01738 TaxID=2976003 RepID=UPI002E10B3D7|nr:CPBP family intramembrane metalloprotease [Nonomuraea sp. NBC_01738]
MIIFLAVTFGPSVSRTLWTMAATWIGVPLIVALALALSAAFGLVSLDLAGLSIFEQGLRSQGSRADPAAVMTVQVLIAVVAAPILNAIPVLGEELGWRGWLQPRLVASRGVFGGLVLTGLIWGLWHFPLTLLGYNYPSLGFWSGPFFVVTCVLLGFCVGWLRLRTGSVWPPVLAHASLNGVAGLALLFGDAAEPPDTVFAGITGLVGWVVLAAVALVLFRLFPVRQADRAPAA